MKGKFMFDAKNSGALQGVKIIELAGLGPVPFACMILGDMGAEVIRIDRPSVSTAEQLFQFPKDNLTRNRKMMVVDLKKPQGIEVVKKLIKNADILIEGFRPGVMEKLGLSPESCLQINKNLIIGRMSGYGQSGEMAMQSGHDINYLSLSGALHGIGRKNSGPVPPVNLIADFGAGAMHLVSSVLAAYIAVKNGVANGQVIDVAMSDCSIQLTAALWTLKNMNDWNDAPKSRQSNWLDGGAPFYDTYECADNRWLAVGCIEPQFYADFTRLTNLSADADFAVENQWKRNLWDVQKSKMIALFKSKKRDEWLKIFAHSNACVTAVLTLQEAKENQHNNFRNCYRQDSEGNVFTNPAPRFSATPSSIRSKGSNDKRRDSLEVLKNNGFSDQEISELQKNNII